MYGKQTLAHTGVALASVTVLGVTVPYLAIGAAVFVGTGAVALRLNGKRKARTAQR